MQHFALIWWQNPVIIIARGESMKDNPLLKYSEQLAVEIEKLCKSLDNKKERWEGAVIKDGLNWINVSSLKGWKCNIAKQYNVTAIPAIFILDEKNHIIASNLRDEQLKEFLEDKLK